MDISLNWLNRYVKVDDMDVQTLEKEVTSIGLEVEGRHELAYGTQLVVGYVHSCVDHPDSDHLHICQVETAPNHLQQIVCGAPNVREGIKVIVALEGCELLGGTIKPATIRGVESHGMICSLSELGVDQRFQTEEQKAGIEILAPEAPVGAEALTYLGLKDTILEIGLTPNRSDCLAYTSFAYEVAAVLNRKVELPVTPVLGEATSGLEVAIESSHCSFFGAKLVKGVQTKESPQWLKSLLMASGIKPINNIVDISNFVMLETGQPIHMYDYDKLTQKRFVVKEGYRGEVKLLDGEMYTLLPSDLIVSTDDGVGCVAGIFGADATRIDDQTQNIVIEAATFDGATLRATARRLDLLTDASSRFIKNAINTKNSEKVLDRCAQLLCELADAKEVYASVCTGTQSLEDRYVDVTTNRVNALCGTSVTDEDVKAIFDRLSFTYRFEDGVFHVLVPSYRNDMTMDADLVEEVARMYGLDHIPSTLPTMPMTSGKRSPIQARSYELRHLLASLGLHEVITYTLTNPHLDDFNYFHTTDAIKLMSPLSEDRSVTRKSLIPSMLQVVAYNQNHNQKDVFAFEMSKTMTVDEEALMLGMVLSGVYQENKWLGKAMPADFYLAKGLVEKVLHAYGLDERRYRLERLACAKDDMHPGRSAAIYVGKDLVGYFGQIHPNMEKKYEVNPTVVVELNMSRLQDIRVTKVKYAPIPLFPSVTRDLAVVVSQDVMVESLIKTMKKAGKSIVKAISVFDVYEGEHVDAGYKSIALQVTFQDETKTLTDEQINTSVQEMIEALDKQHQAKLRG